MVDLREVTRYGPEIGYTLASGKLYCDFGQFHEWCEHTLHRPILTHEFASKELWAELCDTFEAQMLNRYGAPVERVEGSQP